MVSVFVRIVPCEAISHSTHATTTQQTTEKGITEKGILEQRLRMGDCDWDPRKSGAASNIPVYPGNMSGGFNTSQFNTSPLTPSPKPKFNVFNRQRTPNPMPATPGAPVYNPAPLPTFNSSQRSENLLQDLRLKIGQNKQQANGPVRGPLCFFNLSYRFFLNGFTLLVFPPLSFVDVYHSVQCTRG